MKILVLGGTGAMGVHLVGLMSQSGHDIFVTTRSKRESTEKTNYVQGNAHDMGFLKTLLKERWDVIVDFMVYKTPVFLERVELLLKATSQYVFLSSARVYANTNSPIVETSARLLDVATDMEYLSTDEYALTKARQEDILRKSGMVNWTIIRPYITYSENRLQLGVLEKEAWLYRVLRGRTIVFSDDINAKITTLTYGLDVSKGILSVIGNAQALGEAFHITSDDSITWADVLSIYLDVLEKHLGYKPKVLLNNLEDFFKIHTLRYQVIYDRLYKRKFDNSKIAEYIGVETFLPVQQGLKRCIERFLNDEKYGAIDWKLEAIKDKQTKERTPLKEISGYRSKAKYLIYRFLK